MRIRKSSTHYRRRQRRHAYSYAYWQREGWTDKNCDVKKEDPVKGGGYNPKELKEVLHDIFTYLDVAYYDKKLYTTEQIEKIFKI